MRKIKRYYGIIAPLSVVLVYSGMYIALSY